MHYQQGTTNHTAIKGESNTPLDSTTSLINAPTKPPRSSHSTSPNIQTLTDSLLNKEFSSNKDDDQRLSDNSLSYQQDCLINLSGWSVVASWKDENFQMNEHQNAYLENMYASEILPRIYVGAQLAASDKAWLEDHNITHILTVADGFKPTYPESYTYKEIPIRDHSSQNIIAHFDATYKFIQSAVQQEKGNILIHCQAGISRSPTVMIAYMMKTRKMSFETAFDFVRSKRPVTCPNLGYRQQLKLYESLGYQNLKTNPKYWGYLIKRWSSRLL